jgi:hypothetical protein
MTGEILARSAAESIGRQKRFISAGNFHKFSRDLRNTAIRIQPIAGLLPNLPARIVWRGLHV